METLWTDKLEEFIDHHGLSEILRVVSAIADDKADHIAVSYNDEKLSRRWRLASQAIFRLSQLLQRGGL